MSELQTSTPSPTPPPAPSQLGPDTSASPAPIAPAQSQPEPSPTSGLPTVPSPTIASGNAPEPAPEKPYWPEDWKQKFADHISAGNKKAAEKELKRLETMADPTVAWARFRDMENTWASRQFVKVPPKENATEADIKEYHKALGVPEKPEDYFKDIKLSNGAVIGEADKPIVDSFAAVAHKAGAPPQVVNAALDWYFQNQEQQAAALDEADDKFKTESMRALKEELGPAFKRKVNSISSLFASAPGGLDVKNPQSTISRLLGGRTADGRIIGDDPDISRWLISLAHEVNPTATVVDDASAGGKSIDAEISEIEKVMRTDRRRYDKELAPRYAELIDARSRSQARQRA